MKETAQSLSGHYMQMTIAATAKLLEAVFELFVPLIVAGIINVGIAAGDAAFIWRQGALLLGLSVTGFLLALVCQYYSAVASTALGQSLRTRLFRHILTLSHEQSGAFGAGMLTNIVTGDVRQIQAGLNLLLRLGVRMPFLAIGSMGMALLLNPGLGLIFVFVTLALSLLLFAIMRNIHTAYGRIQKDRDNLATRTRENLEGARVIRAFGREQTEAHAFAQAATALTNRIIRVGRISALLGPISTVIINAAILAIVWLGAGQTFAGHSNPGEIVALVSYMSTTLLALTVLARLTVIFAQASAAVRRVETVLTTPPDITDGADITKRPESPTLSCKAVSFTYRNGAKAALTDISFTLKKGETLGIIGPTGSGKSTLAHLIPRLAEATCGTVYVQGKSVQAYPLRDLRRKIGYVPQKPALFTGSVAHNLRLAAPTATDDQLWEALQTAQADFVREMPEGLETMLHQGGQNLSGGQRQRLSIAQALVARPVLLVLDDACSALDSITEAALHKALSASAQETAIVQISQRAVALRRADQILVLQDGHAVGFGRHQTLLETCTVYREICHSQGLLEGQVI